MFFNKKKELTGHQKAIVIMHLTTRINQLEESMVDKKDADTWCTKHDIECLESAIEYLS